MDIKPVIDVAGGAVTGFITNNYAVKMLFKKYGPFGGVLINTREQFIDNLSSLVERDIINNRTVETELNSYEFMRVFYQMVADILKVHLYNNSENITIDAVPGIRNTFLNFMTFYQEHADKLIESILCALFDNIKTEDVFSERQISVVAAKLWDICINELMASDILKNVLTELYYEYRQQCLDFFIHHDIFKSISDNLLVRTANLHEIMQNNCSKEIDDTLETIYQQLECQKVLENLENCVKQKTLFEIFGRENVHNISKNILERILRLLKSEEGQKIINAFSNNIFEILKNINVSLFGLLDESLQIKLEEYMRRYMPSIIAKIIYWIKTNQLEVEGLINRAVDDVLGEESSGFFNFRGKAKKALKNAFYEDVAGKQEIVYKLIAFIESETDIDAVSVEITDKIIAYLKKTEISALLCNMEQRNILRAEYLTKLINNNLDKHVSKINIEIFDSFFANKLENILSFKLSSYFEDYIKNALIKQIKADFLYSERGTKIIRREVQSYIVDLANARLSTILNPEDRRALAEYCHHNIQLHLHAKRTEWIQRFQTIIFNEVKDKKISYFIEPALQKKISSSISAKTLYYIREQFDKQRTKPLWAIYDGLNRYKSLPKDLTGLSIELTTSNLHLLLEGKIKETVTANLSQLPDEKLQAMVEEFMGKELKPINLFGAILGAATGSLLYFGQGYLNSMQSPILNMGVNAGIYGLIGYITNVIALKMIFRPYKQQYILGMPVPFTPGVVTKQKPRFAASMAAFVDNSLLNAERARELFVARREAFESKLLCNISAENYKLLTRMMDSNKPILTTGVLRLIVNFVQSNRILMTDYFEGELKNINLSKIDYVLLQQKINDRRQDYLKQSENIAADYIDELFRSTKSLGTVLPDLVKTTIYSGIDNLMAEKIKQLAKFIDDDVQFERLIYQHNSTFEHFIEQTIFELLSLEQADNIKNTAANYIIAKLKSPKSHSVLLEWLEEKFAAEVSPDKRVEELFGGMLIQFLHQNASFILKNIVDYMLEEIRNNRSNLKHAVYRRFRDGADTVMKLADAVLDIEETIYNVVDDLIDNKFPSYIERKHDELEELLSDFINIKLARTKIYELGINLNAKNISDIVEKIITSPHIISTVDSISRNVVEQVLKLPIKDLLKVAAIHNLFDVYKIFEYEIMTFRSELSSNLIASRPILIELTEPFIQKVVDQTIFRIPVNQLTKGIERVDIDKSVNNIIWAISDSKAFCSYFEMYIKDVLEEIKYKKLSEIADINILTSDILYTIDNMMNTAYTNQAIETSLSNIVDVFNANINSIIADETKSYILKIIVKSVLDSLETHFHSMIAAVKINEITEREINRMSPNEIEDMFNSFAEPYFRKLESYGWFGGIIGLMLNPAFEILERL